MCEGVAVYFYHSIPEVHLNTSDLVYYQIPARFGTFAALEMVPMSPDEAPQPFPSCAEAAASVTALKPKASVLSFDIRVCMRVMEHSDCVCVGRRALHMCGTVETLALFLLPWGDTVSQP